MTTAPTKSSAVVVALASVVLTAVFAVGHLVANDMNPTVFVAVGEADAEIRHFAEERLGPLVLRPDLGHDGRFFFVQANDPWMLQPESHAAILDRPVYRTQRMLYPVLAGLGGVLSPVAIVWGMLAVNVVAMGAGALACARLAERFGGSAWWGLAFPLNLGLISEFSIGGAGVVAAAAAFGAVLLLAESRAGWAAALFAASCLSREVMLAAVAGAALWLILEKRYRLAAVIAGVPTLAVALWGLYIRWQVPADGPTVEGNLGMPFVGLFRVVAERWLGDPAELVFGVVVVLILGFYLYRSLRTPSLLAWTFLPFVALAAVVTAAVWDGYFNITRAVAPVLTAYFLITFGVSEAHRERLAEDAPGHLRRFTVRARGAGLNDTVRSG